MSRKSQWLLSLLLLAIVALPVVAAAEIAISDSDRELGRSLIRRAVANFFGVTEADVAAYMPQNNPDQVFATFFLAAESDQTPQQIREQKGGRGWGVLAKSIGLPANFHGKYISNKHKKKATPLTAIDDAAFEELMALRFNAQYYGKDPDSLTDWGAQGLGTEDLTIGSNLAAKTGKRQGEFFRQRVAGEDWATIARKNKLPYQSLAQPVASQKTLKLKLEAETTLAPTGKGKGQAKDKGSKNKNK